MLVDAAAAAPVVTGDLEVQLSSDSTEILLLPRFGEGLVHRITGRNLFGVFWHLCKAEVTEIGCQVDADKAIAVIDSISFYASEG